MNITAFETNESAESSERLDHRDRLWIAAEKLRLAAVALNGMARAQLDGVPDLDGHIDRLEHRSAELMRAASRLGDALEVAGPWGLDILFQPVERAELPREAAPQAAPVAAATRRKHRPTLQKRIAPRGNAPADPMNESIELAPIELLTPEVPIVEPRRRITRSMSPTVTVRMPPQRTDLPLPPPLGSDEN